MTNNPGLISKFSPSKMKEMAEKEKARRNLLAFTTYTKKNYKVNWHHELICKDIDDFLNDPKRTRLMIWVGPRRGKSEIVSRRLPAYVFGKNPNKKIISTSYADSLAKAMNRDVQKIIDSQPFRELFPATFLVGKKTKEQKNLALQNYVRTSNLFSIVGFEGEYRSGGVDGPLTGAGGDIGIIDDPFKNWEEANSPTIREKVKNWYSTTFLTRMSNEGKIIIINTRWHEDDLCGWLLKEAETNPEADQWEVICLPEIQDEENKYPHEMDKRANGEILWPTMFSYANVMKTKHSMSSKFFDALYQQRPSSAGGAIIPTSNFQYYRELPAIDYFMASWDCTFKDLAKSDYVVGQVWAVAGANKYLVYMVRERMGIMPTIQEMLKVQKLFNLRYQAIEDKANGPAIIQLLKNKIAGLIAINPQSSKESRAHAVVPQIEAGNVFLPDKYFAPNRTKYATVIKLLDEYIKELQQFPNGANDDMVDATTQALLKIGHQLDWVDELLKQAEEKDAKPEVIQNKMLAELMGWNIPDESPTSIFDAFEEDLFSINF